MVIKISSQNLPSGFTLNNYLWSVLNLWNIASEIEIAQDILLLLIGITSMCNTIKDKIADSQEKGTH